MSALWVDRLTSPVDKRLSARAPRTTWPPREIQKPEIPRRPDVLPFPFGRRIEAERAGSGQFHEKSHYLSQGVTSGKSTEDGMPDHDMTTTGAAPALARDHLDALNQPRGTSSPCAATEPRQRPGAPDADRDDWVDGDRAGAEPRIAPFEEDGVAACRSSSLVSAQGCLATGQPGRRSFWR